MSDASTNLLRLRDVADILDVHEQTVRRLVLAGTLPAFLAGGRYRIRKQDLQSYIKRSMHALGTGKARTARQAMAASA